MRAEIIVRLLRLSSPLARRPEHYHDEGGRERDPQVGEGGGGLAAGGVPAKKRKLNIDEGGGAHRFPGIFFHRCLVVRYSRKLSLAGGGIARCSFRSLHMRTEVRGERVGGGKCQKDRKRSNRAFLLFFTILIR